MAESTDVIQGDFCKMPFPDNAFDAVFSVEATCHAGQVSSRTDTRCRQGKLACICAALPSEHLVPVHFSDAMAPCPRVPST